MKQYRIEKLGEMEFYRIVESADEGSTWVETTHVSEFENLEAAESAKTAYEEIELRKELKESGQWAPMAAE